MPERHLIFHSSNGKRRILIIEDELINQQLLAMMLEEYELLFAETGAEALELLQRDGETVSLILLDLNLPDLHGLEVLRRIRSQEATARIPVIVMTAEKDAEVECLTLGAIDFIPKPYPRPEIVRARVLRTIELSEDRDIIRWTERDQLTGLFNKEYFFRYAVQYDVYHREVPTDAIVLDVNHFHMINERYGRAYGDEVLRKISGRLQEAAQDAGGIVCRREADTFLIYCPHREDYEDILETASVGLDGSGRVRLRMGVYPQTDKSLEIERRFDRAKSASDTVKADFTRTIAFYDESLHREEVFEEKLLEDFRRAIDRKEFQIYFQPKFDIRSADPVLSSAEALVRWEHPEFGRLSPGVFVPLFEKNGLILALDRYVWREAAGYVRSWKDRLGITLPVSVNISRIDMHDPELVAGLEKIVRETGLETGELILEITESAYTQDVGMMIGKVTELREKGFLIEMDDFGSGYSSLNMISAMPLDALKLDMMFIRNAFRARKDTRLLEVVIALSESLGVPTIAEGVETAEQMLTLKSMGCELVQGYYFSRPLPAAEFEEFLRQQTRIRSEAIVKEGKRSARDTFTYDALHDPLTGMYNHSAFEILFHDSDQDHIAVLIVDIDDYEAIKKAGGRERADRAVLKVAKVLRENFRNVDDICRLREDEFVIIMTRVTKAMQPLVFDKVEQLNELLRDPADGEPISMSVGVAFSDRDDPEGDIFQDADTALYRMKQVRQRGCAVY
ncbi:MAG: EAL domain-containing protein [Mogibacterium sp.]|nr:EAL domain-containing protein [Mogibacterium sp.]